MRWKFVAVLVALSASALGQQIPLEALEKKFAGKTVETVEVNLDSTLLNLAMKFLGNSGDEARAKELLKDVQAIYVRVWKFDKEGQYGEPELEAIRSQLKGWSKVVDVRSSKMRGENAGVYMNLVGEKIQGLVVVAAEGNELTLVNLVGSIDPARLRELGGTFGIPELGFGQKKKGKDDE